MSTAAFITFAILLSSKLLSFNIIITNKQDNQNSYLLATKAKKIIKKTSNTI